jgi:hypothetical protein
VFCLWLQEIILIAGDCVNRNGMERFGVVIISGKVGGEGTGCECSR